MNVALHITWPIAIRHILLAALCSVPCAVASLSPTNAPNKTRYPTLGKLYSHGQLVTAYAVIKTRYGVDLDSRQCRSAEQMGAFPLAGKVLTTTASRMLIQADDGRRVALVGYRGIVPKAGDQIRCMAQKSGSETLSVRAFDRTVTSVPQYRDVTMTFPEFVGYLRRGNHFPEVPSLQTQPGRKGLFSTERVSGNKVELLLNGAFSSSGLFDLILDEGGEDSYKPVTVTPLPEANVKAKGKAKGKAKNPNQKAGRPAKNKKGGGQAKK